MEVTGLKLPRWGFHKNTIRHVFAEAQLSERLSRQTTVVDASVDPKHIQWNGARSLSASSIVFAATFVLFAFD